jgi:hypothetical protein
MIVAFASVAALAIINAVRGSGLGWLRPVVGAVAGKGAIIGLLAVILAGCAAPQREPNWGAISREVGRTINQR